MPLTVELAAAAPKTARQHFLFVSAPFGPFARQLANRLQQAGARCTRVILNGGDLLDWGGKDAAVYRGSLAGWRGWLAGLIREGGVTDLVTYGDSSAHCVDALVLGEELGVRLHVLEQGYFRPNWVTLEQGGVNANSRLSRDPDWYRIEAKSEPKEESVAIGRTTPSAVGRIVRYHLAMYAGFPLFWRYKAPYQYSAVSQALGHIARAVAKGLSSDRQHRLQSELIGSGRPLFLALLQRPGDSQLWRHSDFEGVGPFLEKVVTSFARHAPSNAQLLIRPHPLDHGLDPHKRVLAQVAAREGVQDRVHFVDAGKLHEILPAMSGAICVNSTAGLAAVEFGCPTVVLGRAMYDMPGLTHQGGIDGFWRQPEAPDPTLYEDYRRVVMARTQINGAYATSAGRALAVSCAAERLLSAATESRRALAA